MHLNVVYVTNNLYMIYTYLIKRKQVYVVFSLCKETYPHYKLLLYIFISNTKMEPV